MKKTFKKQLSEGVISADLELKSLHGQPHYFSVTGETWDTAGSIHEEIAEAFPELTKYLKWHLVSVVKPMYYIENTVYHAKQHEFDYARSIAVWPEATDEQLSLPKAELTALLQARLPTLMQEFQNDIVELFGEEAAKLFCKEE